MTIVHTGLTANLTRTTGGFFPDTGAVQLKSITNTKGNPAEAWADVSGLDSIRCAIAPSRFAVADEARSMPAYAERTHFALLDSEYTAIDPTIHRFLVGSTGYDILGVEHDSHGITTRLHLREVLH